MVAFVRLFPQLHKNAAGIPVVSILSGGCRELGKHTEGKIVRPTLFDVPHPTRQRETSRDPGTLKTVVSEAERSD
jgi:hypothetical protein